MWKPGMWTSGIIPSSSPPPQQQQQQTGSQLRNYTPSPLGAARRGTQSGGQRPTLPHRASTANLSSLTSSANASTTSLPAGLKQQQSMGYRKAVSMSMPLTVTDPFEVLQGILGVPVRRRGVVVESELDVDGELEMPSLEEAEAVEFEGVRLEGFVEREWTVRRKARKYNGGSVEEYEREKEKFQDLHRSIKACDEVLRSVESYLSAFQTDLGTVSAEIESLQNRSTTLNRQLENRKNVEKMVGPTVEDVLLPPDDVRRLVEGEVNESWVRALHETDRRMKAISSMDSTKIKAVQEVQPEFEKITHKTIERVRDFFVSRIKAIRVPGANAQVIQKIGFLQHVELFQFMSSHHPVLAEEIAQAYINTMRWYYHTHFTRYHSVLSKIKLLAIDKTDVLGQEEPSKKTGLSLPGLKSAPVLTVDSFNIGRRIDILRNRTAPILPAAQADDDKATRPLEYPFRHFNVALIENASSEYTFLSTFFAHKPPKALDNMFTAVFAPTFELGQSFTRTLTATSFDTLGALLAVRLNQYAAFEMQKRRIPAAEPYTNATNMLLWPRFQIVISAHCESLRKLKANKIPPGGGAAPHFITQRFASLLQGLVALSTESGDDEPVANSLMRLRTEFEGFVNRLAQSITQEATRKRFLFNNYSLVLTIIGDCDGKLGIEQKTHFEKLKKQHELF